MPPDLPAGDPSDVAAGDPSDVALKSRNPNAAEQPAPRERAKQLHVEAQRRYLERKRQRGPAFAACWQQLNAKEQKTAAAFGFDAATWDVRQTEDVSSVIGEAWDGMECCDDRCDEDFQGTCRMSRQFQRGCCRGTRCRRSSQSQRCAWVILSGAVG